MNQIFTYHGRNFAPPVPILLSTHLRDVKTDTAIENGGKKMLSTPFFPSSVVIHFVYQGMWRFFDLPFLINIPVEASPVIFCFPCQVQFQLCSRLHHSIPTTILHLYTLTSSLFQLQLPVCLLSQQFPNSAMPISRHPCLISCSWGLLALAHYERIL